MAKRPSVHPTVFLPNCISLKKEEKQKKLLVDNPGNIANFGLKCIGSSPSHFLSL
jgi:hypothetical protein